MNTARTERITLRASADEKETIRRKAMQASYTQQKYVLDCALGCPPVMTASDAKAVIIELRRIGNNLNQLAHARNSGRTISKYDLASNIAEVERICQSLRQ